MKFSGKYFQKKHSKPESDTGCSGAVSSISIIIPVLNEEHRITALLEALQVFRNTDHEVIVVDGGSTDSTIAKARPLCDHLVHSQPGRAFQMNKGASVARGSLLLFHHCDSHLPDDALSLLESLSPRAWGRFDVTLSGSHIMFRIISFMMNWRSRLTGIATGDQSIFISRILFNKVGGYPPQYLMEDIEISSRLKKLSRPVCFSSKVTTSSRRWHEKGIWKTILLMWKLRLAYFTGTPANTLVYQYYPNFRIKHEQSTDSICEGSHSRASKNPLNESV